MSDHWKTLARLLGAPGAADPPKPKPKASPAPAKAPAAEQPEEAASSTRSGQAPADSEARTPQPIEGARASESRQTSDTPSRRGAPAGAKAGRGEENPVLPPSLPGFGAVAAEESGDEPEEDVFSGFGQPRAQQRSESPSPQPRRESSAPRAAEAQPRAEREPESQPAAGRAADASPRDAAGELFSQPIRSEGPSSWDELVDRLGVPAAPAPPPRLADSEPLEKPEPKRESGPRSRRPASSQPNTGGGFGAGLVEPGAEAAVPSEPEAEEPAARRSARPSREPERASREPERAPRAPERTPRAGADRASRESEPAALEERDPLEELGSEGWGAPRRGRASADRRSSAEDREESRGGERESSRVAAGPREGRARSEGGRSEGGRSEAERPQEERDERELRGDRARRGSAPAATERTEADSAAGQETAGPPPRRGRRRGQRQRMSVDQVGWADEAQGSTASRGREESDLEDDLPVGFADLDADEELEGPSLIDEAPQPLGDDDSESDEGEQPPRRRRRRGRRRRGSESGAEPTSRTALGDSESEAEPAAVAPAREAESEFDDDHEDDEEAAALRRSRRGRRRRGTPAEPDRGVGEDTPRSSNYGAEADGDEDEEDVVLHNTQRNIPTWFDAVSLLVDSNLESRKGGSPRGGGGGGGRSRGRGRD